MPGGWSCAWTATSAGRVVPKSLRPLGGGCPEPPEVGAERWRTALPGLRRVDASSGRLRGRVRAFVEWRAPLPFHRELTGTARPHRRSPGSAGPAACAAASAPIIVSRRQSQERAAFCAEVPVQSRVGLSLVLACATRSDRTDHSYMALQVQGNFPLHRSGVGAEQSAQKPVQ